MVGSSAQHFARNQVHEASIVVSRSILLHLRLDRVQTVEQELSEEVIANLDLLLLEHSLLKVPFQHRPESFNRVKLWAVRRHEHQFEVEVSSKILCFCCFMRLVIIKHDSYSLRGQRKPSPQLREKIHECFAVG